MGTVGSKNKGVAIPADNSASSVDGLFSSQELDSMKKLYNSKDLEKHFEMHPEMSWFGSAILRAFALAGTNHVEGDEVTTGEFCVSEKTFISSVALCCRKRRRDSLEILLLIVATEEEKRSRTLSQASIEKLFLTAYVMGQIAMSLPVDWDNFHATKIAKQVLGGAADISFSDMIIWSETHVPLLYKCLSTFVQGRCLHLPSDKSLLFNPPKLQQRSVLLESLPAQLLLLAISSEVFQSGWMRLFTSEEDGLSFNRLWNNIAGYAGPTVVLIRDRTSGALFGGQANAPWKEANDFYGDGGMLLQLEPQVNMYRAKPAGPGNFQYVNLKGYSLPHGLGMGGTLDSFRFFLSESLECSNNMARSACLTFEPGELCPSSDRRFEVDCLEVWGIGGDATVTDALEARSAQRTITQETLQRARKVDKAQFANNEFDREMLLGKTFGGARGGGVGAEDVR